MPAIGEIRRSEEIGYKYRSIKYIWAACEICGKERWVHYANNKPFNSKCILCNNKLLNQRFVQGTRGKDSPNWKGGRRKTGDGYIHLLLYPDNFFYPMVKENGYVGEHRLVMAKHLGRCLHRWEIVHHLNHKRVDNRIENLQLVTDDRHKQITILETRIQYLEKRVTLLEAENVRLQAVSSYERKEA